ncbi:hypothetical protein NM208_g15381 [Fusarium decemcellulare]|uniref:Uncharacterized protein n=1 Tax=Fusarium decemcellulare TaxID=57161 RepID=A0ACC1RF22_9HYPO|nr:hypothetical protein NM208_g15381 [Fusarium decemcellulare]
MTVSKGLCLVAATALSGVSGLQVPLNLQDKLTWSPWSSSSGDDLTSLPLIDTKELQKSIKPENLESRAKDLYEIAKNGEDEYGHPTRVIGSEGHLGTLSYIHAELAKLGGYYSVSNQQFPAVSGNVFESRLVLGDSVPKDASPMGLTPPTKNKQPVHGDIVLVDNEGCEESDYPKSLDGNIALILRGTCPFGTKSENAGKAGAVAAVVYNYEKEEVHGTLGTPSPNHVATFGLGGEAGKAIAKRLKDGEKIDAIALVVETPITV